MDENSAVLNQRRELTEAHSRLSIAGALLFVIIMYGSNINLNTLLSDMKDTELSWAYMLGIVLTLPILALYKNKRYINIILVGSILT